MSNYIVIYGDIFEGVQGAVGPFQSSLQAEEFMESHNLGHFEKAVFRLESLPALQDQYAANEYRLIQARKLIRRGE